MRFLGAADVELRPRAALEYARRTLAAHAADDEAQRTLQRRMLEFVAQHPDDAHRRTCRAGHLTASALVIDDARERALLTHHRKLGRWLQLGGHCDGDANLAACALREATEESGIAGLCVSAEPVDLDIHAIPARAGEPEHWHFDVRYAVLAPPGARAVASAESNRLGWFAPAELHGLGIDASLARLVRAVFRALTTAPRRNTSF